ncbi:hypothetical protein GCM10010222_79500 [Streptomyces tanashiensis]|uniref:hypothetical protein n=1 Tax=Streptomyces tanashiensis TaxID=67367 RepID=UPI0019CE30DE|nr:hypothetical protein [Streptomyces tanashiensis]GGT25693.1 hypothetical protein GCM10010222_79500 [Streptomyces tanashiensis]
MIERDDAVRIVEDELARGHQALLGAGAGPVSRSVVVRVVEHELVWKKRADARPLPVLFVGG